jgi:hypothetical protein
MLLHAVSLAKLEMDVLVRSYMIGTKIHLYLCTTATATATVACYFTCRSYCGATLA